MTDAQRALIGDFFPAEGRGGRWAGHRAMIDCVMWRLRTGAHWRDLLDAWFRLRRTRGVLPSRPAIAAH